MGGTLPRAQISGLSPLPRPSWPAPGAGPRPQPGLGSYRRSDEPPSRGVQAEIEIAIRLHLPVRFQAWEPSPGTV